MPVLESNEDADPSLPRSSPTTVIAHPFPIAGVHAVPSPQRGTGLQPSDASRRFDLQLPKARPMSLGPLLGRSGGTDAPVQASWMRSEAGLHACGDSQLIL